LYGGWFEISLGRANAFEKIPYAIKFWEKNGDTLVADGPTFMGWYVGHKLNVCRFSHVGSRPKPELTIVPDFLKRRAHLPPPDAPIRPTFITHIVFANRDSYCALTQPASDDFIVEVSQKGWHLTWSPALLARLSALAAESAQWSLSRTFS
jgi:hypothetical protein